MDPDPTKKRPKPVVAIVAVAVPLLALLIAAVATTSSSDDAATTETTISQAGDPAAAAAGKGGEGGEDGQGPAATEVTVDGKGKGTTTTAASKGGDGGDPDIPSLPANAGPEGERASVTYPRPTVPPSGCARPTGTAVITLGSTPFPACLELGPDQPVVVRNRAGKEVTFVAISVNEVIAAGSEMRVGTALAAFGEGESTFWSPGNPGLSGIVRVG
ncbi:MAG TPA: hypothetical protein VNS19_01535 [Acidimicrobiales bacterium]|nr:hypothetical protein [Acidimicrobiales bacterium]